MYMCSNSMIVMVCLQLYSTCTELSAWQLVCSSRQCVYCVAASALYTCTCTYTVNSPNNRHFGARPTDRYSRYILYRGIIVVSTFNAEYEKHWSQ